MSKMKKVMFTHFRQKRKTFYKRNVLGTIFPPESQKRDFPTFGSKKVKMSSFSASGALLAPKTLQNGKVDPKAKKAVVGVLGSKNVPRTLCFPLFCAWSGNCDFRLSLIFAFSVFWTQNQFLASKSGQNRPQRLKSAILRLFARMASKTPKNIG